MCVLYYRKEASLINLYFTNFKQNKTMKTPKKMLEADMDNVFIYAGLSITIILLAYFVSVLFEI